MTGDDPNSAVVDGEVGAFDETLFLDEVFALCDRFLLAPPVVFQGTGIMRIGEADRAEVFALALQRLAGRRPARLTGAQEAFAVLAAPATLVSLQRKDAVSTSTFFVASAGGTVVEHRPLPDNMHRVARVRSPGAVARAIELCGLVDRPVLPGRTVRLTPAQLLQASAQATAGDVEGAAQVVQGAGSEGARAAFLRALAASPTAIQVTVLDRPAPGRLAGTVTAWLDAGDAGLWRVPAADLSLQGTTGIARTDVLHRAVEICAVRRADLEEEIAEGFEEVTHR